MDDRNRKLTFAQREGIDPLPAQLKRKELSKALRAKLWAVLHAWLMPQILPILNDKGPWASILKDLHVEFHHQRIDKYVPNGIIDRIGSIFEKGEYEKIYGWLEYVLQHKNCPPQLAGMVDKILIEYQAPFRIVDNTFVPVGSEEELLTIQRAADALNSGNFAGAKSHLMKAASQLTQGNYASSVRESISAVESVARVLEPSGELSKALAALEAKRALHGALKKGFLALYGYTSDAQGLRHALLTEAEADVDETDALFFLGACASFVTYLVNKARATGQGGN